MLLAEKAQLSVHDPRVSQEAISLAFTGDGGDEQLLAVEEDPYVAVDGAHAIIVLTEWCVRRASDSTWLDLCSARCLSSSGRPAA